MEMAFDRVWNESLIYEMYRMEQPKNIVQLLISYLERRKLRVRIINELLTYGRPEAGVTHGAVLSPQLY